MEKLCKFLFVAAVLAFSAHAYADYDYPYFTVKYASGAEESYATSGLVLRYVTIDGTMCMIATNASVTDTTAVADLASQWFSSTPTGIESVKSDGTSISYADGVVTINASMPGMLRVYSVDGMTVKNELLSAGRSTVSLVSLPDGIYIVNFGGNKIKIKK